MNKILSKVPTWYQDLASGVLSEVVAIDEPNSSMECQVLDWELGVQDHSTCRQLNISNTEAHEDWRVPYEPKSEDQACSDKVFVPENFSSALLHIEPDSPDPDDDSLIMGALNPVKSYKSKP